MNAVVGDNGILTQAQNATIASKKASIIENLNMELVKYNIGSFTDENIGAREMITDLLDKELIDGVLASSGDYIQDVNNGIGIPLFDASNNYTGQIQYPVAKDEFSLVIYAGSDGTYQAEFGEVTISSGGTVSSGTAMVTQDNFNNTSENANDKGKFEITGDASVMFVDEVSGELSISVKSGVHAKVNIFKNMTLTNAGLKRSAIEIENGGSLDLYIAEGVTVTVNSGFGEDASGNTPGKGGYAGIHVPIGTTLSLYGKGTLNAIGGNAGDGGTLTTSNSKNSGAGGGGAGAGIGGNGGNGGTYKNGEGANGLNGENCGNINIFNSIKLYSYGGAGGSGGAGNSKNATAGGAGGYPAAGIGGGGAGGAGGTCCAGAGGYTGGSGDCDDRVSENGQAGYSGYNGEGSYANAREGGGGYFAGGDGIDKNGIDRAIIALGGISNQGHHTALSDMSGTGGTAGTGGNITVSANSAIYAYNGNMYTDDTSYDNGLNQCPIYLQNGIKIAKYSYNSSYGGESSYMLFELLLKSNQENINRAGYINSAYTNVSNSQKIKNINTVLNNVDMSKQGVGSGAGYIEVSNGTYTVDSSMN